MRDYAKDRGAACAAERRVLGHARWRDASPEAVLPKGAHRDAPESGGRSATV